MQLNRVTTTATAALLLGALPLIAAHGDGHMQMEHENELATTGITQEAPPTYFRHPDHAGWMYAHIALMILGWVLVLPPALMLSIARSRYHLPAQLVFHGTNAVALFTGFVYNQSTPDLYVANAHHPIGWIVTSLTIIWTLLSLFTNYANASKQQGSETAGLQSSRRIVTEDHDFQHYVDSPSSYRFSQDSGNFSGGSRSNSSDSVFKKNDLSPLDNDQEQRVEDYNALTEESGFLGRKKANGVLARIVRSATGTRIPAVLRISQIALEKFLLLLGFLSITSGFVVYGGLFQQREIYSGLAHYIKGGIFFWYGLLTLGRWMGAFAELGWAWNIRPKASTVAAWKSRVPSAEFTESFVIWLYGASNVFLEHLNNWGEKWSPTDFEHVSITILFFGGGLFGMMIESKALRKLSGTPANPRNSTIEEDSESDDSGFKLVSESSSYSARHQRSSAPTISLNPMPALTIMFLGMMMSGHHQASMVSTMMHAQWGMLFTGFAMARAATYLVLYIKPPTSQYPSRPPSELVAAFCLTAGGIMFMNSAHDSVQAIEANGLDAMTIFTLTIGLTGIIMAWELVCYLIKTWAVRDEQRKSRT